MPLFLQEYEKIMNIGKGAFASVYKVRHHDLGYVRAIKVLHEIVEDKNDRSYQTFLNECRLLLKIGNGCHPNIIRIYQPRLIDNRAIVEMDYIDGITLEAYLKDHWVDYNEFCRFAREITGAMAYCHADLYRFLMDPAADDLQTDPDDGSKYIIDAAKEAELKAKYCVNHNDLHSRNIMRRNYDGSFVLLDFGLAIQDNHCVKSSSRGDGAYEYCSPEKFDAKPDQPITSASDVYSLGILLYEMLAGRVPFVMDTSQGLERARFEVYNKHLQAIPEPIEPLRRQAFEAANPGMTYRRDYPEAVDAVIMKALAKNPADRYTDAKELLKALEEAMDTETSHDTADALSSAVEIKRLKSEIDRLNTQLLERPAATSGLSEFKELEEKSRNDERTIFTLRGTVSDLKRDNEMLRKELSERPQAIEQAPRKSPATKIWIGTLVMIVASAVWSYILFEHAEDTGRHFIRSREIIDKIALAATGLSVLGVVFMGIFRKAHTLLWVLTGMILALTGTLQYFSMFGPLRTALCGITGAALALYLWLWLRVESDKNRPYATRPAATSANNNGDEDDDDIQTAEVL